MWIMTIIWIICVSYIYMDNNMDNMDNMDNTDIYIYMID